YPSQRPNSDPSDCVVTPSNCNSDADCDDHNPCTVDRCATGTGGVKFCDSVPGNAGTVCRPSAGPCDVPEYCTGSSADCPPDDSGAGCTCATGAACNDAAISGCTPCTTVANCNDFNACTTDTCIGGACVHTNTCLAPAAVPTETCGNCIDDDGNGLTDFEDPACSGQAGTLTLE